jgi:DNA-binding NtrC family response regulator
MNTSSKSIRQPLGTILPLSEVKRRVIVDALDKCGGNYLLAAHLLGIGRTTIYRMGRMYRYQHPKIQVERLMSMSQCKSSFDPSKLPNLLVP